MIRIWISMGMSAGSQAACGRGMQMKLDIMKKAAINPLGSFGIEEYSLR
jgi:hypothetical protein